MLLTTHMKATLALAVVITSAAFSFASAGEAPAAPKVCPQCADETKHDDAALLFPKFKLNFLKCDKYRCKKHEGCETGPGECAKTRPVCEKDKKVAVAQPVYTK